MVFSIIALAAGIWADMPPVALIAVFLGVGALSLALIWKPSPYRDLPKSLDAQVLGSICVGIIVIVLIILRLNY